jgi:hypothetical protein
MTYLQERGSKQELSFLEIENGLRRTRWDSQVDHNPIVILVSGADVAPSIDKPQPQPQLHPMPAFMFKIIPFIHSIHPIQAITQFPIQTPS